MLEEILSQIARICLGNEKLIFAALLLCLTPTLIMSGIIVVVMHIAYSNHLHAKFRETLKELNAEHKKEKTSITRNFKSNLEQISKNNAELTNQISEKTRTIESHENLIENLTRTIGDMKDQLEKTKNELEEKNKVIASTVTIQSMTAENDEQSNSAVSAETITVENAEESKSDYDTYTYGEEFESQIIELLKENLTKEVGKGGFRILHHVYLEKTKTEYDIILLMTSGIYFIECKSWAGLVIGTEKWDKWIQIKCRFSKNDKLPIFEDGLSAQYFNSPYKQVKTQKESMASFLREYGKTKQEKVVLDYISHWPYTFSKRIIVMNNLNGDTDSNVSFNGEYQEKDYFWYGTSDKLVENIIKYHNNLKNESKNFYQDTDNGSGNGDLSPQMIKLYDVLKPRENQAPWRQNATNISESTPLQ